MVSSGTDYNNEDYAGELWDELEVVLQVQEGDFIEQDETILTRAPGPLFDTPATPVVCDKTSTLVFLPYFPYQKHSDASRQRNSTRDTTEGQPDSLD
jgi:hypothetical protein